MNYVSVKTASNFLDLNGKVLKVIELVGNRVTCKAWSESHGKFVTVDFCKSEIVESA